MEGGGGGGWKASYAQATDTMAHYARCNPILPSTPPILVIAVALLLPNDDHDVKYSAKAGGWRWVGKFSINLAVLGCVYACVIAACASVCMWNVLVSANLPRITSGGRFIYLDAAEDEDSDPANGIMAMDAGGAAAAA